MPIRNVRELMRRLEAEPGDRPLLFIDPDAGCRLPLVVRDAEPQERNRREDGDGLPLVITGQDGLGEAGR